MVQRVFIDTNVLVYAVDASHRAKQLVAQDLLADASLDVVLSAQVIGEFFVTVTRKLDETLSDDDALAAADQLAEFEVVPLNRNLVVDATRTSQHHQLSYWDALIIEAASRAGAEVLYTEDLAAGSTLRGITIVNPFADL